MTNKMLFIDAPHMTKRLAEVNRAGIAAGLADTGAINAARDYGLTLKGTNEEGLEFQTFVDAFFGVKDLLKITQRDVEEYAALTDRFVFVCDLCNVMVSEYDNDDGLHGDVKAFVDAVENELIRRAGPGLTWPPIALGTNKL